MKRQFWGGTSEIHQSYLNGRIDAFLDGLQSCLKIIDPSFAKLSYVEDFDIKDLQSADELKYFFSWLEKEGLGRIKSIANFDAQASDVSIGHILEDCIFILEDTREEEDDEIACENLADAIVYLSKAVETIVQSKGVSEEIFATVSSCQLEFMKEMTQIRNDSNFELTAFDLDFENEFPIAA